MYKIDKDTVLELADLPAPDTGTPGPTIVASENTLFLAYFIRQTDPWFEEKYSKIWSDSDELCQEECMAIVQFQSPRCHLFGPPSEETIAGHPLSKVGLKSFGIYEIGNSSWLNELNKIDSPALPSPTAKPITITDKHYIFAFHDSTFECIAKNLTFFVRHGDGLEQIHKLIRELANSTNVPVSLNRTP